MTPELLPLLAALAAASFLCRAAGFFLMRFAPDAPALDAALKATPVAVMAGIVALTAARGRVEEIVAVVVVAAVMKATGRDLLAALAGVGVVAAWRAVAG